MKQCTLCRNFELEFAGVLRKYQWLDICMSVRTGQITSYNPYDQFVYNYPHSRKPPCSVPFGHIAQSQDNLTEARTDMRSIMSPYGNAVYTSFHVYPFN
ncbi:hypothetical protein AVEN_196708-1 [Araneus ventricosus]|uniref:Uncharacterized protein n=1 Tax=Araneus ventricosus TaxID=182803 RepID=A0A4Y2H1J6_ARAVE|nr:hypothetical protein AVEN_196708-1 [Araneus ventricosus]